MTRYDSKTTGGEAVAPVPRGDVEVAIAEVVARTTSQTYLLANGDQLVLRHKDLVAEQLPALNSTLPDFVSQTETLVEPTSFKAYVTQFKSSTAIIRAHQGVEANSAKGISARIPQFVGVMDYHGRSREGADPATPGRSAHVVTLLCPFDLDYLKWRPILWGGYLPQKEMIELCESLIHTIAAPSAGDLLDALSSIELAKVTRFKSARNDKSGNVSFIYDEQDGERSAEHAFSLPDHIDLVVPIFQGALPIRLTAKLRHRLDGPTLMLGFHVPSMDGKEREAFRSIGTDIEKETNTPVFYAA